MIKYIESSLACMMTLFLAKEALNGRHLGVEIACTTKFLADLFL